MGHFAHSGMIAEVLSRYDLRFLLAVGSPSINIEARHVEYKGLEYAP